MTQQVTVYCPHCGQAYSMLPGRAGQTVQCTQCQKIFAAGVPGSASVAPAAGPTYVGNYVGPGQMPG
jgi:ribosomal protein S27E